MRQTSITGSSLFRLHTSPGQVVSDVSGVVFGGALERFLTRLSLIQAPNLTVQQRQLPICRNVSMLGAVVGVIVGCALGATTLLAVDLEARHRVERAQRLRDIVTDMIQATDCGVGGNFPCGSSTVYVVSTKDLTLPKADSKQQHQKTIMKTISEASSSLVMQCVESREMTYSGDRRMLYAPLVKTGPDDEAEVMAVIAFQYEGGSTRGFSDEDILTCRVMARHIAIFMDRLGD
jgi:Transmembrane protein 65